MISQKSCVDSSASFFGKKFSNLYLATSHRRFKKFLFQSHAISLRVSSCMIKPVDLLVHPIVEPLHKRDLVCVPPLFDVDDTSLGERGDDPVGLQS